MKRTIRKTMDLALTLGTGKNQRESEGDAFGIYLRKKFYSNENRQLKIKDSWHWPTAKAVTKFGEDRLFVVVFKNVDGAMKSDSPGFKYMYTAECAEFIPYKMAVSLRGGKPKINSYAIVAKK